MKYKVNLHITQKCNYRCRYCYAHFESWEDLSLAQWKHILHNIQDSGQIDAINFAGGEPVLYQDFPALVDYAHGLGFRLSVISNGSLMLNGKLMPTALFSKLETLGISVDSIEPDTLRRLGACTRSKEVLTFEMLVRLIHTAMRENPKLLVKLNTVITNLNAGEDLTSVSKALHVDRWKLLRMKLYSDGTFNNEELLADQASFDSFVARHQSVSKDIVPENDLTRSYIIIDNRGRLLDNKGENYKVVGNLLEESFADVFGRYQLDEATYASRYSA